MAGDAGAEDALVAVVIAAELGAAESSPTRAPPPVDLDAGAPAGAPGADFVLAAIALGTANVR